MVNVKKNIKRTEEKVVNSILGFVEPHLKCLFLSGLSKKYFPLSYFL